LNFKNTQYFNLYSEAKSKYQFKDDEIHIKKAKSNTQEIKSSKSARFDLDLLDPFHKKVIIFILFIQIVFPFFNFLFYLGLYNHSAKHLLIVQGKWQIVLHPALFGNNGED